MLYLDFETKSSADLRKVGAYEYANHPSTKVMATGFCFDDYGVAVIPFGFFNSDISEYVKNGGIVAAHNIYFEMLIWNFCLSRQFNIPELKIEQCRCTMVMAYSMGLPGSLEKAAAAVGIEQQKDAKGSRVMLQLSQSDKYDDQIKYKEKWDQMYSYCKTDVEVQRELFKRLLPLSESEQKLWELDYKINLRGIAVDMESAHIANQIAEQEYDNLDKKMREVTNNAVATTSSVGQLTDWLRDRGVALDGVAKAEVTNLLEEKTLSEDCRSALEIRQIASKSSTKKLDSLLLRTSTDKRMRFTLQFYGAGTGRWSGRGFQVQNLPRPKLNDEEIEAVFEILN